MATYSQPRWLDPHDCVGVMANPGRLSIDITQDTAPVPISETAPQLTSRPCQIESRPDGQTDIVASDAGWLRGARAGASVRVQGDSVRGAAGRRAPLAAPCRTGLLERSS